MDTHSMMLRGVIPYNITYCLREQTQLKLHIKNIYMKNGDDESEQGRHTHKHVLKKTKDDDYGQETKQN